VGGSDPSRWSDEEVSGRAGSVGRAGWRRFAIGTLAALLAFGLRPGEAAPRAHVYLFRGLADIFSTGMDVLADEISKRGVYATSHSHTEWKALANQAAADYKAGKEGPIIIVGHSLGADAVMEMADYLGDKSVPVALLMPFDATQSFAAPGNVARVVNFTQRDYAFMRAGPGFRGTLINVDLRSDPNIDHLNIDKAPRLHARAIAEVFGVVGGHSPPASGAPVAGTPKPAANNAPAPHAADGNQAKPDVDAGTGTPIIVRPEGRSAAPATAAVPVAPTPSPPPSPPPPASPPPSKPVAAPLQIPD
jgi:hypothetical protein